MPFYFRKSVSAGPFRFNFSKSGVGLSVGIRGLRIGTGPRGHYIHAGRGGLYYRASLGRAGEKRPNPIAVQQVTDPQPQSESSQVNMVEIESGDVLEMHDEAFGDLLKEINQKSNQTRLAALIGWLFCIAALISVYFVGPPGILVAGLALPGWLMGKWFDSYRRTTVLFYNLEPDAEAVYKSMVAAFDELMACAGKWHIQSSGRIDTVAEWKRNAGASSLVNRKKTTLEYRLPAVIKSNTKPPALHVGRQIIYFLPDVALIEDGPKFGAVGYADLLILAKDSRFIEDERPPSDTQVVSYTWQHPNRSGGPDRRFSSNRQLPVCLYSGMALSSASGLNELVEFSKPGSAEAFVRAARSMPTHDAPAPMLSVVESASPALVPDAEEHPQPVPVTPVVPATPAAPSRKRLIWAFAGGCLFMGFVFLLMRQPTEKAPIVTAQGAGTASPRSEAQASAAAPVTAPSSQALKAESNSASAQDNRPLTIDEVKEVQSRLKTLGFDAGDVDGIMGPQTAAALGRYETSKGLVPTSAPTRETLNRLRDDKMSAPR
jgi:hypothetical protein